MEVVIEKHLQLQALLKETLVIILQHTEKEISQFMLIAELAEKDTTNHMSINLLKIIFHQFKCGEQVMKDTHLYPKLNLKVIMVITQQHIEKGIFQFMLIAELVVSITMNLMYMNL